MDLSRLKKINSKSEIREVLAKGLINGGDIWKALDFEDKENHLSKINEIIIDEHVDKIILKFTDILPLNSQKPIYIKLNYRRTFFKIPAGEFLILGDRVVCNYPSEAHALHERIGGERYLLLPTAGISLSIKRVERTVREVTLGMEVRIVDVSEKGFGIIISGQNKEYLKVNDFFWLKAVNQKELRSPILGTVCYVSSKFSKHGQVRLGLSLSLKLDKHILEELKRESKLTLAA